MAIFKRFVRMVISTAQRMQIGLFIHDNLTCDRTCDIDSGGIERHQMFGISRFGRYIGLPPASRNCIPLAHQKAIAKVCCRLRQIRPCSQIKHRQKILASPIDHIVEHGAIAPHGIDRLENICSGSKRGLSFPVNRRYVQIDNRFIQVVMWS